MPRKKKTVVVNPEYIDLEVLTADPTLVAGRLWFRDVGALKYSPDGSTTKTIPAQMTYEKVIETTILAGSSLTITSEGLHSYARSVALKVQYYHSGQLAWYTVPSGRDMFISDTSGQVRLYNAEASDSYVVILRQYMSA